MLGFLFDVGQRYAQSNIRSYVCQSDPTFDPHYLVFGVISGEVAVR